jgi:hypothetical protein
VHKSIIIMEAAIAPSNTGNTGNFDDSVRAILCKNIGVIYIFNAHILFLLLLDVEAVCIFRMKYVKEEKNESYLREGMSFYSYLPFLLVRYMNKK